MVLIYVELGNSLGVNQGPGPRNKCFGEKTPVRAVGLITERPGSWCPFAIGYWGEKKSNILLPNRLIGRYHKLPPIVPIAWSLGRGMSSELTAAGQEGGPAEVWWAKLHVLSWICAVFSESVFRACHVSIFSSWQILILQAWNQVLCIWSNQHLDIQEWPKKEITPLIVS